MVAIGDRQVDHIAVQLHLESSSLKSDMVHILMRDELRTSNWVYLQFNNFDEYVGEVHNGKAHGIGTYVYRGGHRL